MENYKVYLNYLMQIQYKQCHLRLVMPLQKNGPFFKVKKMKEFNEEGQPKYSVKARITSGDQDIIIIQLIARHMGKCAYVFIESDATCKNFYTLWEKNSSLITREMNFNLYDTYVDESTKGHKFFQVIWMHKTSLEGRFYDGNKYSFPDYMQHVNFVFGTKYDLDAPSEDHPSNFYVNWFAEMRLVTADIDDGAGMWERAVEKNAADYGDSPNPWTGLTSVKTYFNRPELILPMFTNRRLTKLSSVILIGKKSKINVVLESVKNKWKPEKDLQTTTDKGYRAYKFTRIDQSTILENKKAQKAK